MEAPLTLLYTANIQGDLALLPRLYTFLQRLKSQAPADTLLLDLGASCRDNVWHCRATGNRSSLIALDGMGYDAANVHDALDADSREKLSEQVTLALVDRERPWRKSMAGIEILFAAAKADRDCSLQILLEPAAATGLSDGVLRLKSVGAGQVGEALVELGGGACLLSSCMHDMPAETQPNASIAGMVEFVEAEARYYFDMARGKS